MPLEERGGHGDEQQDPEEEVAYHEAGHAVAACALGLSFPEYVTIVPFNEIAGGCQCDGLFSTSPEMVRLMLRTVPYSDVDGHRSRRSSMTRRHWRELQRARVERQVMCYLAGIAAELRRQRLRRGEARLCFADLVYGNLDDKSDIAHSLAALEVFEARQNPQNYWLLDLWNRTWRLIDAEWPHVERTAAALLKRKTLEGDELTRVLLPAYKSPAPYVRAPAKRRRVGR